MVGDGCGVGDGMKWGCGVEEGEEGRGKKVKGTYP